MTDRSFVHLALLVSDLEASISFYGRYAGLEVVHRRRERGGGETAWMHDGTRPFVLVLLTHPRRSALRMLARRIARGLARFVARPAHLGIACGSRAEVEQRSREAAAEGRLVKPANDAGPVVGFYAMLADPDGYNLELSYGQEIGLTPEGKPKGPLVA